MSLSNQQYEAIIRCYETTRNENRLLLEDRQKQVYSRIPGYEQLEDSVSSLAVQKTRLLLENDASSLSALQASIEDIRQQKRNLLKENGFPEDYLDPIYSCPDCKDTGYILTDDNTREKCHCFRQQEITLLYRQSNIQTIIAQDNFSTLSYEYFQGEDLEHFQKAVAICKEFVRDFSREYRNILLYGTVGTGKSFLSGCVANELLKKGHSVLYFSAVNLFDTLAQYSFHTKSKEGLYNFCDDLYNCELVIIDDLGTEMTNSFVATQLFSVLNERHLRNKATIISTNYHLEELRDIYSDRVFSRITGNYTLCKLTGTDVRMYRTLHAKADD